MALADLLTALDRDAGAEIRAIHAEAAAEVARIDAGAGRARADRLAAAVAAIRAERGAEAGERLAAASHRARAEVLAARAAMLDRLRAAVAGRLPAVVAGDPALGARLIAAALACTGDEPGTLRCGPALVPAARSVAPPAIRVEPDPEVTTGAVIELATGTRIEATLAALLERAWPGLACEALAAERAR
jgi:vacuolar-type H+-ATPase subunit E/Vma4